MARRRRRSRTASAEDVAEIRSGTGSARDKAEAAIGRKKPNAKFRFKKIKRKKKKR